MENIKISVVVPAYNVEDYIRECLDSILIQELEKIEVIIVNDGSTDNTGKIADEYANKYKNFCVIHQENQGLGAARNNALVKVRGEYVAFLDSDDYFERSALQKMYNIIKETGSDMITGNICQFSARLQRVPEWFAPVVEKTRLKTHILQHMKLMYDSVAWNKLYRTQFLQENNLRFPEGILYEDAPFTIPAHCLASSVDVISDVVYYWRFREGSITNNKLEIQNFIDRLHAAKMIDDYFEKNNIDSVLKEAKSLKILNHDLKIYINKLHLVDSDYCKEFQQIVCEYLSNIDSSIIGKLPNDYKVKLNLIRENRMVELIELLKS